MKILSGDQMARWDKLSIERHGISARALMQRAGEQCASVLIKLSNFGKKKRTVIVCGPGNNGGDGLVMARWLQRKGYLVSTFFPSQQHFRLQVFQNQLSGADFLVDAIFGIGLSRPIRGVFQKAIQLMNQCSATKLAVDIPSGIDANTGEVLGIAFRADHTITFEVPKWGQILPPAWDYVGELHVVPIGLDKGELRKIPSKAEWVDHAMARRWLPRRFRSAHKGSAGQVLVVAGSSQMPGAGYLCALSALRTGAGLVRWVLPEEAFRKINLRYPEVILHPIPSQEGMFCEAGLKDLLPLFKRFDALAIGPGLGRGPGVSRFLSQLFQKCPLPMVLDADALDFLSKNPGLVKKVRGQILTPHPKEFSRLVKKNVSDILGDRVGIASRYAKRHRLWLLLKGYRSVMAGPRGEVFINSSGSANLATAGSGDVLSGVIAAFLAQKLPPKFALPLGVYLHGHAGDLLAKKLGDRGTLASDIAKILPRAIKELM